MEGKRYLQSATNIVWVEYWVQRVDPKQKDFEVYAEKYDEYRWICEFTLPLINQTVKSISEKEVNAMLNAAKKAAKFIDAYMKDHPELKIKNTFKNAHWVIESNEDGKFISTQVNKVWMDKMNNVDKKNAKKLMESTKRLTNSLIKTVGTEDGFYLRITHRSVYDSRKDIREILNDEINKLNRDYKVLTCKAYYNEEIDSVIVFGRLYVDTNSENFN